MINTRGSFPKLTLGAGVVNTFAVAASGKWLHRARMHGILYIMALPFRGRVARLTALTSVAAWSSSATGQWHSVRLQFADPGTSQVLAADGLQQGGYFRSGNDLGTHPVVWNGSHTSYVDLWSSAAQSGEVRGMDAGRQFGSTFASNIAHAAMWSGTAASLIDLNPPTSPASEGRAIRGNQQVGIALNPNGTASHAALWRGTAASFVDLNPAGAQWSEAWATDGQSQGGRASIGGTSHAALWNGSATTFVDLNPTGSRGSAVWAMAPGVQVGQASLEPFDNPHAALWRGSSGSFFDLNPPTSTWSEIHATNGRTHSGQAWFGAFSSAVVWLSDSPVDYINLQALLPPGYSQSGAMGIAEIDGHLYVSGWAYASRYEAFLWTDVPAPVGVAIIGSATVMAWRRPRRRAY